MDNLDELEESEDTWHHHRDCGWVVFCKYRADRRPFIVRCRDWSIVGDLPPGGGSGTYYHTFRLRLSWMLPQNRPDHEKQLLAYATEFAQRRDQLIQQYQARLPKEDSKPRGLLPARQQQSVPPQTAQKQILSSRFHELIRVIQDYTYHPVSQFAWDPRTVYKHINGDDERLAQEWLRTQAAEDPDGHIMAKMLSARCAEKIAIAFYQGLGCSVEDVSVRQLAGTSVEWRDFDLLVDRAKPVDVKNARSPVNDEKKNRYVSHCIPRFKESRQQDVTIGAVLSPYLRLNYIRHIETARFDIRDLVFLGETTQETIRSLGHAFSEPGIDVIPLGYKGAGETTFPPWLFEFPAKFYSGRAQRGEALRRCLGGNYPDLDEFHLLGINPIPLFLSVGLPLPESWEPRINPWQAALYRELLAHYGNTTLPVVFLTILVHFLRMATDDQKSSDFLPEGYRRVLYPCGDAAERGPLGIIDPLGIVDSFISTLDVLWRHRREVDFRAFESFQFKGLGLLLGTRKGQVRAETILAYCGGKIPSKGKCGFSPLIAGKHRKCPRCWKLVCPKCSFCTEGCGIQECDDGGAIEVFG